MGNVVLQDIGKAYKQYPSRWSRLVEWFVPGAAKKHQLHWVLQGISFTVQPGDAIGIVGINGAGKSTLLKMITGTTKPTTGSLQIKGQVAALLELGMGFHPDYTGRQNVYMAGQLLGMTTKEIRQLMPEIEAFAEIGEYIDKPVRVYSSGMQMRLAFSVATAKRPDVLIVDEALSVGDTYFQHKSFNRIRSFNKQGTTLLLVSHDRQAIQSICNRALLLHNGRVGMDGTPEAVMDYYNALLASNQNQKIEQRITDTSKIQTISGTGEATAEAVYLTDEAGKRIEYIHVGQRVHLCIKVRTHHAIDRLVVGYGIKDQFGQVLYGTNTDLKEKVVYQVLADQVLYYAFVFNMNLGQGSYSVQTSISSSNTHLLNNYEWRDLASIFHVINKDQPYFAGVTWLDPEINVSLPNNSC